MQLYVQLQRKRTLLHWSNCSWHAILHQANEFHPYKTTYYGNMTSYRFFKIADSAAHYYFWFHIVDVSVTAFRRSKVYHQTNFC